MRSRWIFRLPPWVIVASVALGLNGSAGRTAEREAEKLPEIRLCVKKGVCITVEVAATDAARQRGLMFRTRLPADRGMLFVFDTEDFWPFWMKNTRIPLDMIWIGSDKTVAFILEDVPPCKADPCPTYAPLRRARYVLEVPAGSVRKWKLSVGQPVTFEWPPKNPDSSRVPDPRPREGTGREGAWQSLWSVRIPNGSAFPTLRGGGF